MVKVKKKKPSIIPLPHHCFIVKYVHVFCTSSALGQSICRTLQNKIYQQLLAMKCGVYCIFMVPIRWFLILFIWCHNLGKISTIPFKWQRVMKFTEDIHDPRGWTLVILTLHELSGQSVIIVRKLSRRPIGRLLNDIFWAHSHSQEDVPFLILLIDVTFLSLSTGKTSKIATMFVLLITFVLWGFNEHCSL